MNCSERPELNKELDADTFREYYWLKEELVSFCRSSGIPSSGGKTELSDRIYGFLKTGIVISEPRHSKSRRTSADIGQITPETIIEDGLVCSEKHRAFFKEQIGNSFSFNVAFQKWLRSNSGKTYADAVEAYRLIKEKSKAEKTVIGSQFEYNTYIRAFFEANKGRPLEDAIRCWNYKKSLPGHNRYEDTDLKALEDRSERG